MLTIPDTISLHRATRVRYMKAARAAREDYGWSEHFAKLWIYAKGTGALLAYNKHRGMADFRDGAMRCFLRHARAANHKLVAVKRLARALHGPNNWDGWI